MRLLLIILLFITSYFVKAQASCAFTPTLGDVFYANTVSTPTSAPTGVQILCGPNTVVYDTLSIGCLFVHVNTGCTLFYNKGCPQTIGGIVWLKNNSTLNILAGSPGLTVYYEPLATINNPASIAISSYSCASITFPAINCATGINESAKSESTFFVYPNPSSSSINIEFFKSNTKTADISIFNQLGELMIERKNWNVSEKQINTETLSNGIYFIEINTEQGKHTEKLVINR